MTAMQRSQELLPPNPAAAEAECISEIYHVGSYPVVAVN
jgi:hypothetical protein